MDLQGAGDAEDPEHSTPSPSHHADIHHDPWLIPATPALTSIAASVFQQIEDNSPRLSRTRRDATERRRAIVENLVASLALLVLHHAKGARMAVSARNVALTRYDRPGFSREIITAMVTGMESLGLLHRERGARREALTTIQPTESFRHLIAGLAGRSHLDRLRGGETIILKASVGRGRPKVLVDYADTPETNAMRRQMATINDHLARADITLDGNRPPPFLLTRRFQIEHPAAPHAFDSHGRLYGGFWMNLPKTQRHLLRIDGEEIADLDYVAMFPQLAYLEAGLPLPEEDPYAGIGNLPRAAAKLALSALLCRSGPMQRLPTELREVLSPEWTAARISHAVAERHQGIAHLFGTGAGLRLMFRESEILIATMLQLVDVGVTALPMHDGLMVSRSKTQHAVAAMEASGSPAIGRRLPILQKLPSRPAP